MRCRVKAGVSRAEQVTATKETLGAPRAPACSHEDDRGGLQARQLHQQRSGRHDGTAMRVRWRRYLSSASRTAVDNRHVRTIGSNSGQEPPAASLRPASKRPARKRRAAAKLRVALYGTMGERQRRANKCEHYSVTYVCLSGQGGRGYKARNASPNRLTTNWKLCARERTPPSFRGVRWLVITRRCGHPAGAHTHTHTTVYTHIYTQPQSDTYC